MKDFFKKLAIRLPERDKAEISRDIARENFIRSVYCSILLIVVEIFVLFINGAEFSFLHIIVISTIVYNAAFLAFFYLTYRKGAVKGWHKVVNALYFWILLLVYCSLSVFPQNEIATIDTYIMAVIAITALLYIPPWQTAILFSSVYIIFFFVLPFYQPSAYTVHVLRINAFAMNLIAWFLSRLVYQMKVTALADKKVIEEKNAMLKDLVVRDPMTSLFNHESAYKKLEEEMHRSRRIEYPLSIMMTDMDDFKAINDKFGHLAGDRVIVKVAQVLVRTCRKTDIVCRYGGEEYVLIMPDTNTEQALQLAERIRNALRTADFENDVEVTLSGGISEFRNETVDELIGKADTRLYKAKAEGKNRFVGYGDS